MATSLAGLLQTSIARLKGVVSLIAASITAAAHTGDTAEHVFATITIKGGKVRPGDVITGEIRGSVGANNANAKTFRVRVGGGAGTAYVSVSAASNLTLRQNFRIEFLTTATQKGGSASSSAGFGLSSVAGVTSAVNTENDWTIVISGQLATGTDTITLESYSLKLERAP